MRPETIIPKTLSSPYPLRYSADVVCGFGRGSADLGIPTANIPVGPLDALDTGIYFGWCKIVPGNKAGERVVERSNGEKIVFDNGSNLHHSDLEVQPMVMSIGWNPFYENKQKAAEVHVMHKFNSHFYGASMEVVILGYIRPELNYTTKEALIEDIQKDVEIAHNALASSPYDSYKNGF